jgi:hypothetical protein
MPRQIPDSSACWASLPGSIPLALQTALRLFSASVIDFFPASSKTYTYKKIQPTNRKSINNFYRKRPLEKE